MSDRPTIAELEAIMKADADAAIEILPSGEVQVNAELAALREQNAALVRDKERLEYVIRTHAKWVDFGNWVEFQDEELDIIGQGKTWRDACDAAMREETEHGR